MFYQTFELQIFQFLEYLEYLWNSDVKLCEQVGLG